MKKIITSALILFLLSACDTFGVQPQPFPVWSPIPSRTPDIVSPTPIILTLPFTLTPDASPIAPITLVSSETLSPTTTLTPISPTIAVSFTPFPSVQMEILGCNTSIDSTHSMGEVTNAFVTVKNTGTIGLSNICSLLRGSDEDREHPDKQVCVSELPSQYQVTLKLTIDTEYQQDTAIQVDTSSNDILLLRVDKQSCTEIGLFASEPADLGLIKPIQP